MPFTPTAVSSAGGTLALHQGVLAGQQLKVHQFGGWSYFYAVAVLGNVSVDRVNQVVTHLR